MFDRNTRWLCVTLTVSIVASCSDGRDAPNDAYQQNAGGNAAGDPASEVQGGNSGGRMEASDARAGSASASAAGGGSYLQAAGTSGRVARDVGGAGAYVVTGAAAGQWTGSGGVASGAGVAHEASAGRASAGAGGSAPPGLGGSAGFTHRAGAAGFGTSQSLSQTGLYESDMKTIRAGVVEYEPRFELWSDGAAKRRWIFLPEGSVIDTTDPDYWIFPVGTKVWKEFNKDGKRIETRIIERTSTRSYRMVAYLWREDSSDADAVPDGMPNALNSGHDVPDSASCETCHMHQPGRIVGVSSIQLDHAGGGLTLAKLAAAARLSTPITMRPLPGDATAQAALGILHSNCGICHHPRSMLPFKSLDLWQRVSLLGSIAETPMYRSTVGVSTETNPSGATPTTIVVAGDPAASALVHRMGSRADPVSMPPLASKVVDQSGLATVSAFIAGLK